MVSAKTLTQKQLAAFPFLDPKLAFAEIVVSNNGLGFNQKYAGQLFNLFQLHARRQYPGIGQALCRNCAAARRASFCQIDGRRQRQISYIAATGGPKLLAAACYTCKKVMAHANTRCKLFQKPMLF